MRRTLLITLVTLLLGLVAALKPLKPLQSRCPLPASITHIKTVAPSHRSNGDGAKWSYSGGTTDEPTTANLATLHDTYELLKRCPRLTGLSIHASLQGCSGWPDRFNMPVRPGDRFPALKEVRLHGYDFDDSVASHKRGALASITRENQQTFVQRWRERLLWGEAPERLWQVPQIAWSGEEKFITPKDEVTNLGWFRRAMDWRKMEVLEVEERATEVLRELPEELTSLRELKLQEVEGNSSQIMDFIKRLPNQHTLTRLELVDDWDQKDLETILHVQGKELKVLNLSYSSAIGGPDGNLTPDNIRVIGNTTNLSNLTSIVDFAGPVQDAQFAALARLENLQHLDLSYQMPQSWRGFNPSADLRSDGRMAEYTAMADDEAANDLPVYNKEYLNPSLALDVFERLRESKRGKELLSLKLRTLSTWSGPRLDGPIYFEENVEYPELVTCQVTYGNSTNAAEAGEASCEDANQYREWW